MKSVRRDMYVQCSFQKKSHYQRLCPLLRLNRNSSYSLDLLHYRLPTWPCHIQRVPVTSIKKSTESFLTKKQNIFDFIAFLESCLWRHLYPDTGWICFARLPSCLQEQLEVRLPNCNAIDWLRCCWICGAIWIGAK